MDIKALSTALSGLGICCPFKLSGTCMQTGRLRPKFIDFEQLPVFAQHKRAACNVTPSLDPRDPFTTPDVTAAVHSVSSRRALKRVMLVDLDQSIARAAGLACLSCKSTKQA